MHQRRRAFHLSAVVRHGGLSQGGVMHSGLSSLHVFFFLVSDSIVRIKSGQKTAF
jgi:hypothetical protein